MRIAQVAPLIERVPPIEYGGTERVVSWLTEELVRRGHEVTLFASGDSITNARLIAPLTRSLRRDPRSMDRLAPHLVELEQVFARAEEFDVIHFHLDYLHYPISRRQPVPHLTTLHGRLDIPELVPLHRVFSDEPVVSISSAQRQHLPWLHWMGTIHHGLPKEQFSFYPRSGPYLAFLGRISPEKRLDWAVEIARRSGKPLRVAAKLDDADRAYHETGIKNLLREPGVEFVGEIDDSQKNEFLGGACAVLFTVDWPEPFGLVMIESLACGTPVIAFRRGSVPEVISEGESGFIVDTVDEAVRAVGRLDQIDRVRCRQIFEKRFTATRMTMDYERVYSQVVRTKSPISIAAGGGVI